MSTYTAIFESAPGGAIWGWIPEIPGATGMGETIEEAEAIEVLREADSLIEQTAS